MSVGLLISFQVILFCSVVVSWCFIFYWSHYVILSSVVSVLFLSYHYLSFSYLCIISFCHLFHLISYFKAASRYILEVLLPRPEVKFGQLPRLSLFCREFTLISRSPSILKPSPFCFISGSRSPSICKLLFFLTASDAIIHAQCLLDAHRQFVGWCQFESVQ